eukprot:CAMPEP_0184326060 /NCGR_PEP_ID=MMETSP1049-20130417/142358_1 /TAXON_ID=77928 /ORGANISM="Proteomonas sulcata, Strain CCMP704" /LENGTH=191 /DNA_ID=CAMNT_0026648231 /DNA_START=422 /DNA_END=997 /DNA_ORIENTATION=+
MSEQHDVEEPIGMVTTLTGRSTSVTRSALWSLAILDTQQGSGGMPKEEGPHSQSQHHRKEQPHVEGHRDQHERVVYESSDENKAEANGILPHLILVHRKQLPGLAPRVIKSQIHPVGRTLPSPPLLGPGPEAFHHPHEHPAENDHEEGPSNSALQDRQKVCDIGFRIQGFAENDHEEGPSIFRPAGQAEGL